MGNTYSVVTHFEFAEWVTVPLHSIFNYPPEWLLHTHIHTHIQMHACAHTHTQICTRTPIHVATPTNTWQTELQPHTHTHTSRQSLHTQATNLEGKILTHKQPRGTVWINTFYSAYHTVCLSTHLFIFFSSLQIQQTRNFSVDLLSSSENKTIIICIWGCLFGGVYVPCIYSLDRSVLP